MRKQRALQLLRQPIAVPAITATDPLTSWVTNWASVAKPIVTAAPTVLPGLMVNADGVHVVIDVVDVCVAEVDVVAVKDVLVCVKLDVVVVIDVLVVAVRDVELCRQRGM